MFEAIRLVGGANWEDDAFEKKLREINMMHKERLRFFIIINRFSIQTAKVMKM